MTFAPDNCWCVDCYLLDGLLKKTAEQRKMMESRMPNFVHSAPNMPDIALTDLTPTRKAMEDIRAQREVDVASIVKSIQSGISEHGDGCSFPMSPNIEPAVFEHVAAAYHRIGWYTKLDWTAKPPMFRISDETFDVQAMPVKEKLLNDIHTKVGQPPHAPKGPKVDGMELQPDGTIRCFGEAIAIKDIAERLEVHVKALREPLKVMGVPQPGVDYLSPTTAQDLVRVMEEKRRTMKPLYATGERYPVGFVAVDAEVPIEKPKLRFQVMERAKADALLHPREYFMSRSGAQVQADEYNADYPQLFSADDRKAYPDHTWAVVDTETEES